MPGRDPGPTLAGRTPKGFTRGTHRVLPPEDTVRWLAPRLPPLGITRVADVTGLDRVGVPVTMVCRPNSRSLSVSQGKGTSLPSAKASGLMEAIELYHAERVHMPLLYGSHEELRYTHKLVEPTTLPMTEHSRFHRDLKLLWVAGIDLMNEKSVWVPLETVHTDFTLPAPSGAGCFAASSNGLASGNHLLEAVSHGLSEVVERDALTLAHLAGARKSRLDLESVLDPECRWVLDRLDSAGLMVAVWEVTSDIELPVFECLILDRADDPGRRLPAAAGMGCHPAREVALSRALTEAAQSRLTMIAGSRDDVFREEYARGRDRDRQSHLRELLQAVPCDLPFDTVVTFTGETFEEDVTWELDRLRATGIGEVVVVNLTRPEFSIPVVRVVVPGLEGVDHLPGFTPGRRALARLEGAA